MKKKKSLQIQVDDLKNQVSDLLGRVATLERNTAWLEYAGKKRMVEYDVNIGVSPSDFWTGAIASLGSLKVSCMDHFTVVFEQNQEDSLIQPGNMLRDYIKATYKDKFTIMYWWWRDNELNKYDIPVGVYPSSVLNKYLKDGEK